MDSSPKINNIHHEIKEESIDVKRFFQLFISAWPWFLISIFLTVCISLLYLRYQTPLYNITARVLINDDKKGGGLGQNDVLGDLGGVLGGKNSVDNEVEILKTRDLLKKVVIDMKLNITYFIKGRFREHELYNAPFSVSILDELDTIRTSEIELQALSSRKVALVGDNLDTTIDFDKPIKIPGVGLIQIHSEKTLPVDGTEYTFSITSIDAAVNDLMQSLLVASTNKQVTVVDFNLSSSIPKKGEDILNKLIEKYVQGNIDDKNLIADSTIKFIQNRLSKIGYELGDLEGNIQGFKERNNLADMTEQSKILVQNTSAFVNNLAQAETQIAILASLESYLKDDSKNKRVLPSAIMPDDIVFNGLINRYNALLLERDRRLLTVTETNPLVVNIDDQITVLRVDLLSNIENTKRRLLITRNGINKQMQGVESNMQQVPKIERNYLELARQQQIKQQLYLFLMQKAEETAISKTANLSNSRTIDSPKSAIVPFSPRKSLVVVVGIIIGLIIPVIIIYISDVLNNKIETKEDVTQLTDVSILGEISRNTENENLIVGLNSRSAISEQFRALRTNLSFYLKEEQGEKTIMITSSMSGEGKSFIAINLGTILAMTGKKVLLMEMDLRKPGLSHKLGLDNTNGFTNYILDENITAKDIIKPLELHSDMFLISSGPIPPNPAENLMHKRASVLFKELKSQFDYIIIDVPPIGLVTDAQLLEPYSNLTLYIVRQKYTFKEQINLVQDLYVKNRMGNLGIVVNDILASNGYGYGYGYGANYGTYGNEVTSQGLLDKIFRRKSKP